MSGAGTDSYVSAKSYGTAGSSGGWIGLNNANHDDWCLSWARVNGPTGTSPKLYYNDSSLWFVSYGQWGPWLP